MLAIGIIDVPDILGTKMILVLCKASSILPLVMAGEKARC